MEGLPPVKYSESPFQKYSNTDKIFMPFMHESLVNVSTIEPWKGNLNQNSNIYNLPV